MTPPPTPTCTTAGQNRLLSLNYVYHGETDLICDAHRDWGQSFQRLHPRLPPRVRDKADEASGRKLRVSRQCHCVCRLVCCFEGMQGCTGMSLAALKTDKPWGGTHGSVQVPLPVLKLGVRVGYSRTSLSVSTMVSSSSRIPPLLPPLERRSATSHRTSSHTASPTLPRLRSHTTTPPLWSSLYTTAALRCSACCERPPSAPAT